MGKDKTKWNTFDRFCEILATTLPICSNELYSHGMTNSKAASKVFKKLQLETKKNTNFTFPTAKGSRKYKDGLPATCNAPKDDKRVKDFFDTFIQENKKWIVNEIEKEISAHSNKKQSLASQIQGDNQLLKIQKEKEELLERFKKQEEDIAKQEEQYVKPLTKLVNEVAKLIEVKKEKIRQKEEEEKNQIEANYQSLFD
ncbi:hypothetical protein C9374_014059 [Naegleria lovaniensis]|uniref:Uncharacterized protein n=1 Tax=Naegleria lovaniensis TaxID=51637 RepID=A0AA88GRV4_NAELO|nr:uncharacterized protein C9374_011063 [Naegleria lovaniensis]XP_044549703.1 uncharacterized protein C9374_003525 [Naegleria lovaniensis]XP_044553491.1 uncharacterized protein C9374_014059 [Naegleria lovaniensis]KAG2374226.1 hypothetical protein C9374_011063 [Naegleria lovaniensis]KAG2385710.1 hypothetical protein C9374_003525 [Naegleria lovaniensis]KAG2389499.1 hypothetical protein C9374_014059 [Naegleria lovaniensis]